MAGLSHIDLWQPYREAVQMVLPEATLVADKFHVLKFGDNGAGAAAQGDQPVAH